MAGFEYRNAEDVRDAFKRHGVKYLFFGKSGAILLGFSDTTQDVDVFVEKPSNSLPLYPISDSVSPNSKRKRFAGERLSFN